VRLLASLFTERFFHYLYYSIEAAPLEKDQMDEDKPEEAAKAQSRFYTDFWSLQTYFNNPTLLTNSPDNMTKFQESIDKTLAKFASIEEEEQKSRGQRTESISTTTETPATEPTTDSSTNQTVEKKRYGMNKDKTSSPGTYFPKFLTSPKLLQLEVIHGLLPILVCFTWISH
jgi:archaellum component FlaD/FlaE